MFNIFFGALLGTMIGILGALGTIAYLLKREIKKLEKEAEEDKEQTAAILLEITKIYVKE